MIKFSICILTFNRGHLALKLVRHLLPLINKDWEILILNNASTKYQEEYRKIAEIALIEPSVNYVHHDFNRGFHGNFLACFEFAKADYIQMISDEDFPNTEIISHAIEIFQELATVGAIRGSVAPVADVLPRNSIQHQDIFLSAGREALLRFSLSGNYLSGVIYNKKLLQMKGLIARVKNNILPNVIYPQMYLDILICSCTDVMFVKDIIAYEGPEAVGDDSTVAFKNPAYCFSARAQQFIAFTDNFIEALELIDRPDEGGLRFELFTLLSEKYFFLLHCDNHLYVLRGLDPAALHEAFLNIILSSVSKVTSPHFRPKVVRHIKCIFYTSMLRLQSNA